MSSPPAEHDSGDFQFQLLSLPEEQQQQAPTMPSFPEHQRPPRVQPLGEASTSAIQATEEHPHGGASTEAPEDPQETISLSQLQNTRRRPRDESEQPGRETTLERVPPIQNFPGPWPPRGRSLMIYLEDFVLQPDHSVMFEGQFMNLDDIVNITRRPIDDGHILTVRGPLRVLPRDRWALYVLEVMNQLTSFLDLL